MSFKLGNTNIGELYVGSNKIAQAYLGSNLVYQAAAPGPEVIKPNVSPEPGASAWSKYYGPAMSQSGEVKIDLTTTYIINYPTSNVKRIMIAREDSSTIDYGVNTYNNPSGTITIKFGDYIDSSYWNDTCYIKFLLIDNDNHSIYVPTTLTPL